MTRIILMLGFIVIGIAGCIPSPYYQKYYEMPKNAWSHSFSPNFSIDVNDTNIYYNIHFIIRHTNNYPYSNIWLNVLVKQPGDSTFQKTRIEIPLADPQGKWLGNGMGEIFEQRRMLVIDHNAIPITDDLVAVSESSLTNLFRKNGTYEIRLEQNMRDNVLPEILHVGLRVEKSSSRIAKH